MIDWGRLGPASGSPTGPSTPTGTAPVAPVTPGALGAPTSSPTPTAPPATSLIPDIGGLAAPGQGADETKLGDATLTDAERNMTKEQVDKLGIFGQMARGWDKAGDFVFGAESALNDTVVEDLAGGIGTTVYEPLKIGADVLHAIPLGWLPGGADETFGQIGEYAKANDPTLYAQWLAVDAAAAGDWNAGDLHADFNTEALKYIDDQHKDSKLGANPTLGIGRAGIGSLGDAFTDAAGGWLGLASNQAQLALGSAGFFDATASGVGPGSKATGSLPTFENVMRLAHSENAEDKSYLSDEAETVVKRFDAGEYTEEEARSWIDRLATPGRDRIDSIAIRDELGMTNITDIEQQAYDAYKSGQWSKEHASEWLVSHGQGISGDPNAQLVGSVLTDPLTPAAIGAGAIAAAGLRGAAIAEAGLGAASNYDRLAVAIRATQELQVAGHELGPAFRIARGLIDPLAVYKPSAVARAVTDLTAGTAVKAFDRAYNPFAVREARAIAREFNLGPEFDSAIASYSLDQANLMIARTQQRSLLEEGLGEAMVHTSVDDVIQPMAKMADRDAVTQLTDHMMATSKNTFLKEDDAILAGRMAATFGNDAAYWSGRLAGKSDDLKSIFHATTYKRAEVEFAEATAKIDTAAYTGDLPLRNAVLMSLDTLDDVDAKVLIDNIRAALKNEEDVAKIASATSQWNEAATRYPKMANLGYAPGGKVQLEDLVKALEEELQSGRITRRALPDELSDPALRPLRDMLDRNTMPGASSATPEEQAAQQALRQADAEASLAEQGFSKVSKDKFFAAAKKAAGTTKSNGRKVSETLYLYSKGEYAGMRTFLSADGKSGFAIKPDGDLVSVFNVGEKGAIQKIVPKLKDLGATKLDAFDEAGRLPELYGQGGFKEVRRVPWDPQYAPPGWTGGTPDVVYMEQPARQAAQKPLWKIGFRPDEEVAWGLRRDRATGKYIVDRDPTISHVMDAVPGRQRFSDTTRNVLGQTIGKSIAERVTKPLTAIEAMSDVMRDSITGRRLVLNVERRFEKTTFAAGVPKPLAKEIMAKAREVAGLDMTTVRGIQPANLWKEIDSIIPRNLVLKDGSHLNIHTVMDHLLQAAEGDLRIMGVTSVLSQRMRNALRKGIGPVGDPANWAGKMTVTMYNKLRYSQPMFLIQRITDSPYYSILYGAKPVGKAPLSGANAELRIIEDNLGRTGLARDFSMDMPEYATRSNFTAGVKSAMQDAGIKGHRLQAILDAPDTIIANNMTNMLHARLGNIVRGTLDNLTTAAEKGDPALRAEMLAAAEQFTDSTFGDLRRTYSEIAGRTLTDDEVGLQFIKDQLNAWRRHKVNLDGTLDFENLIAEGERAMPSTIGEVGPIQPDRTAIELGFKDAADLRRSVTGHTEMVGGEPVFVKGEHDIPWLEENLRTQLQAHPDYIKRATAYWGDTWDGFWGQLARPIDEGGRDISAHYAAEAQELIAGIAKDRGMDPWEYLSGVMLVNLGPEALDTAMGRLVNFLKGGSLDPSADWSAFYRSHLDPSAQQVLVDAAGAGRTGATGSIEAKMAAGDVAGSQADNVAEGVARGGTAESGGAMKPNAPKPEVPEGFTVNQYEVGSGEYVNVELPKDGLFRVTTVGENSRIGKAGASLPEGVEGFGSKGDLDAPNRMSILTNRARAETYLDRLRLANRAARGEADAAAIAAELRPAYVRTFGEDGADAAMAQAAGGLTHPTTPEELYSLVQRLDSGLSGGTVSKVDRFVKLTAPFESAAAWDPAQIGMQKLAVRKGAVAKRGIDSGSGELTFLPEDLHLMEFEGAGKGTKAAMAKSTDDFFSGADDSGLVTLLKERVASGVPHPNPDVEAALQQVSELTQRVLKGTAQSGETRKALRQLVEGVAQTIPTTNAAPFSRTQALVVSLLKQKIRDHQQDIFRLAEMQTQRTVLERSLNHPLFGIYPASYMWGKVLPESFKFFMRNPYGLTYAIGDVQRSIAIQREFNRDMEEQMNAIDRSSAAFLLDYLTPGLPWNAHEARVSPLIRDLLQGKPEDILPDELHTVDPRRWYSAFTETATEALKFIQDQSQPPENPLPGLDAITGAPAAPLPAPGTLNQPQITGPVSAGALAPILMDDLSRLQSILLEGASPEE